MNEYNHNEIERKWQQRWQKDNLYRTPDEAEGKDNFYSLVEFPYPSGNLHLGHWYAFAVPDIYARFKEMSGHNVLFPIGFDAFGLPAENAAIERDLDPKEWTDKNIEYMTGQLERMGASFDWSRSFRTTDPAYYKWTQYFFTQFFANDLAYQKEAPVNWCPGCQTVLANEQVIDGQCERCDSEVETRDMKQWFLSITDYADDLIDDLVDLDWPEEIKASQKNWIGRKEGAIFSFSLSANDKELSLPVFTTRPDTLFGVTYLALAPEHALLEQWLEIKDSGLKNKEEVKEYVEKAKSKSDRERQEAKKKTGVKLEGVTATHPATGDELPIFVADYVLPDYGTGAIMAVPAHDERDYEFAAAHDLQIKDVVAGPKDEGGEVYTGSGGLINSGDYSGTGSEAAAEKITDAYGAPETTYRLRDWSVGRQRYWGTPIPIVYDPEGTPHPVPEKHLPWKLPEDVDHTPSGEPPLARSEELKERTEKIFGEGWTPETATMDTFMDSSWYYLRYPDPDNEETFAAEEALAAWMPVDFYSGGAEHTTMHLLYARFFYKALSDLGLVEGKEPFRRRMNRGLIMGPDGQKMSKSKGNVIDPDEQVEKVGADTVRTYLAFIGPYNEVGTYPWDMGGIAGVRRFLEKVWRLKDEVGDEDDDLPEKVTTKLHQTIKKVTGDTESLKFNTAISAMMEWVNMASKIGATKEQYTTLLRLLAPFAPHITEELWHQLGQTASVHAADWPTYDPDRLGADTVNIAIQVDGTVRGEITIDKNADESAILAAAKEPENVQKWLSDTAIKRHIYVPEKLINFVTDQ